MLWTSRQCATYLAAIGMVDEEEIEDFAACKAVLVSRIPRNPDDTGRLHVRFVRSDGTHVETFELPLV